VALYGGGAVRRYTPDGVLDEVIEVAAKQVIACTFGSSDLDQLFITTSREGLRDGEDPLTGSLFRSVVGIAGLPVREFAGLAIRPAPGALDPFLGAFPDLSILLKQAESEEPTSGLKNRLPLLQLRVRGQWLLSVAEACKSCIDNGFSVPCIAHYCRELRPG